MLVQNSSYLILTFVGIMVSINQGNYIQNLFIYTLISKELSIAGVTDSSCPVSPSEYAYKYAPVTRVESASANCRRYPVVGGLPAGTFSADYIHCDGTKLRLADNHFGSIMYNRSHYYMWASGSAEQLLFIFPTRVSLTTITLHYYSDSVRGLPRLRFYAVADDFAIWDALTTGTPYRGIASVPPGGEPAGRRNSNISINVNFNTQKVLMYKYSSTFEFAVSEMEFFRCMQAGMINTYHSL
jgi:hypothetical protein